MLPAFSFGARHKGSKMNEWVKSLPDYRWEPSSKRWYITGTGGQPIDDFLAAQDLILDRSQDPEELAGVDLADLFVPKLRLDPANPSNVQIRPMLVGKSKVQERIGFGAVWNKADGWFNAPVAELFELDGTPKAGLDITDEMVEQVIRMRAPLDIPAHIEESASALAVHIGSEDEGKTLSADAIKHLRVVSSHTGRLPEWFGLALFPFQECGAYAVAAGHNLLSDEPGLGKGGTFSSPILTPTGWTTYGAIKVGDLVIGSNGRPTATTGVFPRGVLDVFRVICSDGSSTIVDGEHLWPVREMLAGGLAAPQVLETQTLRTMVNDGRELYLPMVEPVEFAEEFFLPIEPYQYGQAVARAQGRSGSSKLQVIADSYLFSSLAKRIKLLNGLLDEGAEVGDGIRLECSSHYAVESIKHLVESLGGQVIVELLAAGAAIDYSLKIILPESIAPFTNEEKAAAWADVPHQAPSREIISIEPAGKQPVICISVAADDHLYVTEHFIVTHNTRTSLASAAIRKASRVVVVCPPLVLTNWGREIRSAFEPGIHIPGTPMYRPEPVPAPEPRTKAAKKKAAAAAKKAKNSFPEWIAVVRAGRKMPAIPDTGFVIVPDSLLSSRPELLAELLEWAPEATIFDEVHRARTWDSKRATASRTLASSVLARGGLTVPTTGTPILASPMELLNLLAMTGHLYRGWGGAGIYIERYLRPQKFGGFAPRKRELPALGELLRKHVWTRRNKKDVLTQLPPKWRTVRRVEIDERPFRDAHAALYDKLSDWVDEFGADNGRWPGKADIDEFVHGRAIELMSPLRVAAGVAKIPAAEEIIREWMQDTTVVHADGTREYTRPLLVWAHHKEVLEAMANSLDPELAAVGVISGATSSQRRQELADEFQAGKLGVLVCSIIAAGFGLTLTRCSDVIFIEQDWTPAQISQAEDRAHRISQENPVMITTLYADNTLDPSLRAVLMNKGDILEAITPGSDNRVTKVTAVETEEAYEEFTGEDVELARSVKNTDEIVTNIIDDILRDRQNNVRRAA